MVLQLPTNFDVSTQELDVNETFIRDELKLRIENWAQFRYLIHVGNDANNLYSPQPISKEKKEAYRELGKPHYEVIVSLVQENGWLFLLMRQTDALVANTFNY